MSAAELALGLRANRVTAADVAKALWADRTLVKAFGPRGTVHLFPAHEWGTWSSALSALPWRPQGFRPGVELDRAQTEAVIDAVAAAVADADLTIGELDVRVGELAGAWACEKVMPAFGAMWPRWRMALTQATVRGIVCFGPNRGRNVTYTSLRRHVPGYVRADERAALAEVALRFLRAYGPATSHQFARWFGAPQSLAAQVFASLAGRLVAVKIDGAEAWLPSDDERPAAIGAGLRLLPYFDPYVVGCYPRELVFPGVASRRALKNGQAGTIPVMLIDGVVSGVWHQRNSGGRVHITAEPFAVLSRRRRAELDEQVERVGSVVGRAPVLTIGTVTAGNHL